MNLINELLVFDYWTISVSITALEVRNFDFVVIKLLSFLIGMMTMITEKLINYLNEA